MFDETIEKVVCSNEEILEFHIETNKFINLAIKYYYLEGTDTLHNPDGPAYIESYHDDSSELKKWYIKGNLHRLNGPAVIDDIFKTENDESILEWWLEGKKYSENEYKKKMRSRKLGTF